MFLCGWHVTFLTRWFNVEHKVWKLHRTPTPEHCSASYNGQRERLKLNSLYNVSSGHV